ncbi:aldehyde dehydrogenase family protein [Sphingomonas flavalba]|uniref:aldehyde dehydrogenase family protein n=1 Tax=Sphingomonas flavalba TaxID=2559804 RepID=UPI0039E04577
MRLCANTVKRLSLELGGNSPFIIFNDADVDLAVAGIMSSKFRNAGQTCISANRILIQSEIHDCVVDRLGGAIRGLKVGNGADPDTDIGPLISAPAAENVRQQIADALANGGHIAAQASLPGDRTAFVAPTLITNAAISMRLAQEEIFGPVAAILKFDDEAEAVGLANDTPAGLAAYFYTSNANRSWRVAEALEYGMIGLNTGAISTELAPFGGVKQSGFGREGGREGIDEFLQSKSLHWSGIS